MVFVFGLDVPLIEMFVLLILLVIFSLVILVIMLRKQTVINKKLDTLLDEEREIKEELDITKLEEDKQLLLMRRLVQELGQMGGLSEKKEQEMERILDSTTALQTMSPGSSKQTKMLQSLIAQINGIDGTIKLEAKQLDYIAKVVHHNAELLSSTTQQLKAKTHELSREKAWSKLRK